MESFTAISFFSTIWSKEPETTTLQQFIEDVRGEKWKAGVERYRALRVENNEKEAARIKSGMPAVTPACRCNGGHQASCIDAVSGLACLDFDHTGEGTQTLFERACALPWTAAAFISISGQGLKVFVRIDIEHIAQYPACYRQATVLLQSALGVQADPACKNINRLCYASHHPQAYYNPQATPIVAMHQKSR